MESLSLKFTLALGQARPTQRRTGQGQARPIPSPTIQWNVPGICDADRTGLRARVCVCVRACVQGQVKQERKGEQEQNRKGKDRKTQLDSTTSQSLVMSRITSFRHRPENIFKY